MSNTTITSINGTNNNDTISGGATTSKIDAKVGGDVAKGGSGNEWIKGGSGDDSLDGGAGSDQVDGGSGNDRLIYTLNENTGAKDVYDGGSGTNTLQLNFTRAEWMRDDIQADLAAFLKFLASDAANANGVMSSKGYTFTAFSLQVIRFSALEIKVDGVAQDPRDEAVVAVNDKQTTATEHSIVTGNVTSNDSVPDLVRGVELVTGVSKGALTLNTDGSFVYDPGMAFDSLAEGQSATVSFSYRVTDADRDSAIATDTITITGTNDAPIANTDTATTGENTVLVADVLVNDTDVDNGDTRLLLDATVTQGLGTVAVKDNKVEWTPGNDYDYLAVNESATVQVSYKMSDNHAAVANSKLTITVTGVNDAPIAYADTATTTENTVVAVNVLANDTDLDTSDTHTVTQVSVASGLGSAAIVANKVQWSPGSDYDYLGQGDSATVTINYTESDNHASTAASVLTLQVTGVNDAPTVAASLAQQVSEQDPVFDIDLLSGAKDVDQGAVLSVSGFAETTTQGGWTLAGNKLHFDPNHFDPLNTGQTANLNFSYKVMDEHGAVTNQTLSIDVAGYTDAPLLAVQASAGATVNEIKLHISTKPATTERVALSFDNLPAGATVFDANHQNVTAGVANMIGARDFYVVLPPDANQNTGLGVTVTGMRPDNTAIASRTGTIDIVYDHDTVADNLEFSNEDQGMWAAGAAPIVAWHEYIPILGNADRKWNGHEWEDTGAAPWSSGEFSLLSADVKAADAIDIALVGPKGVLDAAKAVFKGIDDAAHAVYDAAVVVYNAGVKAANDVYNFAAGDAKAVFDNVVGATAAAATQAAYDIYNGAVKVASDIRDAALVADFLDWFTGAIWDTYNFAEGVAHGILNGALDVIGDLEDGARSIYNGALHDAKVILDGAIKGAGDILAGARSTYEDIKQPAQKVLNAAITEFNHVSDTLKTQVIGESKLEVKADLFGKVGVQVDFVLDSGSVDTAVNYQLTSVLRHNQTTDVLSITPMLANKTTGTEVAFSTMSPYAKFHADLLYDVGANLDVFLDSNLVVAGNVIWDLSPNSDGIHVKTTVSTDGWGADFNHFKSDILSATGPGGVNFDGVEMGKFTLVDFDTRDIGQVEVPFVGTLTEDIAKVEVGLPHIETEGTAAHYDPSFFAEGGLIGVDISEITQSVLNLINARIDFSPELREKLHLASLYDAKSIEQAVDMAGKILMGTVFDALDGQVESTPVFLIDANDHTPSELIHANLIPDSVMGNTTGANTAKYGFYTSYGESNDLVKVTIDIDQAVAVIVNKIIEVAADIGTEGATVEFLAQLPDINPLDLKFDLADILAAFDIPPSAISDFFNVGIGFETAGANVYSSLRFSQEFSLSIDDMLYKVDLEDGQEYLFAANQQGSLTIPDASSHDANHNGIIEYDMQLVPKAMFSNDTEIGLTVGYVLDFLKASFAADVKMPGLDQLLNLNIPGLPEIKLSLADIELGPLLRVQGDLDLASADVFEARFPMDLGSAAVTGGAPITSQTLITVVGSPDLV